MNFDMNDSELTLWCGNLSNRITEELLYELFLQAGPLKKVSLPKNSAGYPRSYGFITFKHECSVAYAAALFQHTKIFDRPLLLKQSHRSRQSVVLPTPFEEKIRIKEPTSWTELNALKGSNEDRGFKDVPSVGLGLALEPDFNMLLQMGSQMMLPPNLPMQGMGLPYNLGDPVSYPSQMEDKYGSRSKEPRSRSHHQHHPYEQDRYRDRSNKESHHRDQGRSHYSNRESSSSSSHHHRERRDRHH